MWMDLGFVCQATGGVLLRGTRDIPLTGLSTDSRKVAEGALFAAIPGERFDGHQFLGDVCRGPAGGVLVERGRHSGLPGKCGVVEVENVRRALARLGAAHRARCPARRVAIAGSNGKTTVKELSAAALRGSLRTLWSEGSFNNDLGVPFTLLRLEAGHQAAVFELGTNHPGELAPLIELVAPDIGVITSIGREHMEFFHDLDGVAREEGTLAEMLPSGGCLVLNAGTHGARDIRARASCKVVTVGEDPAADWRVGNVQVRSSGTRFDLLGGPRGWEGAWETGLLGRHQALNCTLAMAVACELGVPCESAHAGLQDCRPARSRMTLVEHAGIRILDDSYNANADSMLAALRALEELDCAGRRVAVLGDMAELGDATEPAHREVGSAAARARVDLLVTVGRHADLTLQAAMGSGLARGTATASVEDAVGLLSRELRPGDLVLVKASRSAGLDQLVRALAPGTGAC